jgi:hypothetical protein
MNAENILTTRPARQALKTFAKTLRPMEANVIAGLAGSGILLAPRENVDLSVRAAHLTRQANDRYFERRSSSDRGMGLGLAGGINRALGRRY